MEISPPQPTLSADKSVAVSGTTKEVEADFKNPFSDNRTVSGLVNTHLKTARPDQIPQGGFREMWENEQFFPPSVRSELFTTAVAVVAANGDSIPVDDKGNVDEGALFDSYFQIISPKKQVEIDSNDPAAQQPVAAPSIAEKQTVQELRNELIGKREDDLEVRTKELAVVTKRKGMGLVHGKLPKTLSPNPGEFTNSLGFIIGEDIPMKSGADMKQPAAQNIGRMIVSQLPKNTYQNRDLRAAWVVSDYHPSTYETVTGTEGFIRQKPIKETRPFEVNGKRGENDWIQFDYYMPVTPNYDMYQPGRPGQFVVMSVAVPPEIGEQIATEAAKNPYFPDQYFKHMYPGLVGTNIDTELKREQMKEIMFIDQRSISPDKVEHVSTYPQPIPY